MHAALVTVHVDDPSDEEGLRNLRENVAPGVARAPGFIAGYWLEPDASGESLSVVLFDSEDTANGGLEGAKAMFAGADAPPGVQLKSTEVRGVAANA